MAVSMFRLPWRVAMDKKAFRWGRYGRFRGIFRSLRSATQPSKTVIIYRDGSVDPDESTLEEPMMPAMAFN